MQGVGNFQLNPFCINGMTIQSIRELKYTDANPATPTCSEWGVYHHGEEFYRVKPGTCTEKPEIVYQMLYNCNGIEYMCIICGCQLDAIDPNKTLDPKIWREMSHFDPNTGATIHPIWYNNKMYVLSSNLDQLIKYSDENGILIPPALHEALVCHAFKDMFGVPFDETTRLIRLKKALFYLRDSEKREEFNSYDNAETEIDTIETKEYPRLGMDPFHTFFIDEKEYMLIKSIRSILSDQSPKIPSKKRIPMTAMTALRAQGWKVAPRSNIVTVDDFCRYTFQHPDKVKGSAASELIEVLGRYTRTNQRKRPRDEMESDLEIGREMELDGNALDDPMWKTRLVRVGVTGVGETSNGEIKVHVRVCSNGISLMVNRDQLFKPRTSIGQHFEFHDKVEVRGDPYSWVPGYIHEYDEKEGYTVVLFCRNENGAVLTVQREPDDVRAITPNRKIRRVEK